MPGYIKSVLKRYKHVEPIRQKKSPHKWIKPTYGHATHLPTPSDTSELLPPDKKLLVQQIVGSLLFYARVVDPTLRVALSSISSYQDKPTIQTWNAVQHILDYCHTYPEATIQYDKSDMILKVHSDASYLSEPEARSRIGGHFFLVNKTTSSNDNNGQIIATDNILRHVVASAAEAEYAGLFFNSQIAISLRTTLNELGFPQPPTPLFTDNTTAAVIANRTNKPKMSKSMDMRFHWIQDRIDQGHICVHWRPGEENLGDYFTKHHPPSHHLKMRKHFLIK